MQDPENLGAILRIASALAIDAVVLGPGCCDPFSRRVLRVSMGAALRVKIVECDDLGAELGALRDTIGWSVDLLDDGIEGFNKFIPYYLYPEINYSVSLLRSSKRVKVSVGWNPWSTAKREHNLAALCERYGGGGHPVVAAISFEPYAEEKARAAANQIVAELRQSVSDFH